MKKGRDAWAAMSDHARIWSCGWRLLLWVLWTASRAKLAAWLWMPADRPVKGRFGPVMPEIPVVEPVGPRLRGGAPHAVALPALT